MPGTGPMQDSACSLFLKLGSTSSGMFFSLNCTYMFSSLSIHVSQYKMKKEKENHGPKLNFESSTELGRLSNMLEHQAISNMLLSHSSGDSGKET